MRKISWLFQAWMDSRIQAWGGVLKWVEYKQGKWLGYKEALGEGWVKERMRYEVDQSVQSVLTVLAVQAVPSRVDPSSTKTYHPYPSYFGELPWVLRSLVTVEGKKGDAEKTGWHSCKVISILEYAESVWSIPLASSNHPLPLALTTHALPYLLSWNPSLSFAIYCNSWWLMNDNTSLWVSLSSSSW